MSNPGQGTLGDLAPGDIGLGDEIEQLHGLTNVVLLLAMSPSHVSSGGGDLSVTISGFRLVNPTTLHFGGNSIATLWINAHTLSAVIPAGLLATPGNIVVFLTNSKGTSNSLIFSITGAPVNRTITLSQMALPIVMSNIGLIHNTHQLTLNSMGLPIAMADIALSHTGRSLVLSSMALPIVMSDIGLTKGTHLIQLSQMTLPIVMNDILLSHPSRTLTLTSMALPIVMAPILLSTGVTLPDADFEPIPVQSGMDIFTPNVGGTATGPAILAINNDAAPQKAVNIVGNAFTTNLGLRFYSQTTGVNGIFFDDTNQSNLRRLNGNLTSWSIPSSMLDGAGIMVWPETAGGIGKGILLNKADPQFVLSKNTGFSSAMIGDTMAIHGNRLTKAIVSSSTATIGTGSKTFSTNGGTFTPGQQILVLARSVNGVAGGANFMDGTVASSTANSVTVNVSASKGSGTFSAWKIYTPNQTFVMLSVSPGQSALAQVTYADPWTVEFVLPNQIGSHVLVTGDSVSVAVANGLGGKYGWKTCPIPISVQTAATLGMNYASGIPIPASGDTTGATDSAAFIAAISACVVPTRFQLAAANYYIDQQIFMGGHVGVAISLQGQGKGSTFLNAASGANFANNSMFQCNTGIPAELNALTVVATGNTTFSTNGVAQISRFVNADIRASGTRVPIIGWGGGGSQFHGYATGCTFTGTVVFGNNPLSVYVDNCARLVTDGDIGDAGEIGFWFWNSRYASITRTTCQDFTPNGPLNQRGGGKFVDFNLYCGTAHVSRCTTTKLSPIVGDPIMNSGEQILTEGSSSACFAALVQSTGTVSGVTTLTFSSPGAISSPCHAFAVAGNGTGQWANVTGRVGNTFTLDRLWLDIDTTTQVNMILAASEVTAVMNTLDGNNQPGTSSGGWEVFDGAAGCVFAHNTVTNCVYGASDFGIDITVTGVFEPPFWNVISDNLFSHCQYAIRSSGKFFIGNLYRDNQGITTSAEWQLDGGPTYTSSDPNISDTNTFTGAPIGVYSQNGIPSGQSNQFILLWNTQFVGSQTGPAFAAQGYQADLQGNSSFTGFTGGGTGKIYYVANSGNDSNPGTPASPFLTLQRGVATLLPGDTLIATAGTYAGFISGWDSTPATISDQVGVIAGNATNRITIKADPSAAPGSVIINSRCAHVLAGIDFEPNCDYIDVIGFTIDDTAHGITQSSNRGFGFKSASKFGSIQNCTVKNITYGQGIFVDNATNVRITGNTVFGTGSQGNDNYGHGMYVSGSTSGAVVTGNTIHDNERLGIHVNGDVSEGAPGIVSNATIANNIIYSNGENGINCDGIVNSLIDNNLVYDYGKTLSGYGIVLYQGDAGAPSTGNVIVNNTFYTTEAGSGAAIRIENGATGCTVLNNIMFGGGGIGLRVSNDSISGLISDYNIAVGATFFQSEDTLATSSLAAWHTAHGQDAHSVGSTAAATFVTPGSNFNPLNPGPAIAAGTNTDAPATDIVGLARVSGKIDIGCYAVQVLTSLTLYPQTVLVPGSALQAFTPYPLDQVGNLMVTQPTYTFSVFSGSGSINSSGVYTAPASGSAVTKVAVGSVTSTSAVTMDAAFAAGITTDGSGNLTIKVNGATNNVVTQVVTLNNQQFLSVTVSSTSPNLSLSQQYPLASITHIYLYGQLAVNVNFTNTAPIDCTVFGGTGTNSLQGGPGNDYVQAGSGGPSFSQSCKGFAGNNTIVGGPGSNSLYGGSGTNIIVPGLGPNQIFPNG